MSIRVSREQVDDALRRGEIRCRAEAGDVAAIAVMSGVVWHRLFPEAPGRPNPWRDKWRVPWPVRSLPVDANGPDAL